MNIIRFLKDWTLPVAIALGATVYLLFYYVPQLDGLGNRLGPVIDVIFPVTVFLTLLATFCKVDFHQMRPHRWHIGVLAAQVLLVVSNLGIIFLVGDDLDQQLIWQGVLTCTIAPSASAAPVVTGKARWKHQYDDHLYRHLSPCIGIDDTLGVSSADQYGASYILRNLPHHSAKSIDGAPVAVGLGLADAALCEGGLPSHCLHAQSEFLSMGRLAHYCSRCNGEEYPAQQCTIVVAHGYCRIEFRGLLCAVRHWSRHWQTPWRGNLQRSSPVSEEHLVSHLGGLPLSASCSIGRRRLLCAVAEHHQLS